MTEKEISNLNIWSLYMEGKVWANIVDYKKGPNTFSKKNLLVEVLQTKAKSVSNEATFDPIR